MSRGLEQRYRRVLRLLPGYYRDQWEEDMVAAFLDSWLTGDREADEDISEFCRPSWPEIGSAVVLAARLYLGGAGAPRRYFAWGQAVRRAVLVVLLVHTARALDEFVRLAWTYRLPSWLPAPPANLPAAPWGGVLTTALYGAGCAWMLVFALLVFGHYRTARVLAVPALVPGLVSLVQAQVIGNHAPLSGPWAYWVLLDLAPVLAMAAFHRDAPPAARRPWLLALPVIYLLVYVPVLAVQATGNARWLPDAPGVWCLLIGLACLAHAPRALRMPPRARRPASSGVWSLTLTLLAAVAGICRIVSLADYPHDQHLVYVGLAELLVLAAATTLVTPDAVRAQAATPAASAPGLTSGGLP